MYSHGHVYVFSSTAPTDIFNGAATPYTPQLPPGVPPIFSLTDHGVAPNGQHLVTFQDANGTARHVAFFDAGIFTQVHLLTYGQSVQADAAGVIYTSDQAGNLQRLQNGAFVDDGTRPVGLWVVDAAGTHRVYDTSTVQNVIFVMEQKRLANGTWSTPVQAGRTAMPLMGYRVTAGMDGSVHLMMNLQFNYGVSTWYGVSSDGVAWAPLQELFNAPEYDSQNTVYGFAALNATGGRTIIYSAGGANQYAGMRSLVRCSDAQFGGWSRNMIPRPGGLGPNYFQTTYDELGNPAVIEGPWEGGQVRLGHVN